MDPLKQDTHQIPAAPHASRRTPYLTPQSPIHAASLKRIRASYQQPAADPAISEIVVTTTTFDSDSDNHQHQHPPNIVCSCLQLQLRSPPPQATVCAVSPAPESESSRTALRSQRMTSSLHRPHTEDEEQGGEADRLPPPSPTPPTIPATTATTTDAMSLFSRRTSGRDAVVEYFLNCTLQILVPTNTDLVFQQQMCSEGGGGDE